MTEWGEKAMRNIAALSRSSELSRLRAENEKLRAALRTPPRCDPSEEEIARALPKTPRDIIAAGHMRNWGWGQELAYNLADTLITELALQGFHITRVPLRAPALPSEEEIKAVVRRELTDKQDNITLATSHMVDVLRAGCKAVGYGVPTSVDEAADKFAGFVARAVLALLGKTGGEK